jgi:hypothetical protein
MLAQILTFANVTNLPFEDIIPDARTRKHFAKSTISVRAIHKSGGFS